MEYHSPVKGWPWLNTHPYLFKYTPISSLWLQSVRNCLHFVLLLSSLQFPPFVQPVEPSWLTNIMFCVPHTAGFSGSCPVAENLTYGHSSSGDAGTKVLFILPPHPRLPQGPQMVWGVKLATLQSPPPDRPTGHSCPPCPLVISSMENWVFWTMKYTPDDEVWLQNNAGASATLGWGVSCLTTAGLCLLFTLTQRKGGISINGDMKITFMRISHLFPVCVFAICHGGHVWWDSSRATVGWPLSTPYCPPPTPQSFIFYSRCYKIFLWRQILKKRIK